MSRSIIVRTVGLGLLALLASCASKRPLEPRTLPYHVVIVPMETPLVGAVSPGEFEGDATEMRLHLDEEELTAAVSEALEQYCFADVTVIRASDLEADSDVFGRQREVLDRAHALQADLIVELGLRYDAEIYRKKASTFWLNYPLFLFAGPSNWFIGDNVYYADVDLTTSVYDMNVIDAGGFELGDPGSRVMSASSRYTGADLDFVERSDGVGDYALGILIPSGFLSRESNSTEEAIHEAIIEELRVQVVQGVQSRRGDLVSAEWIAPVYIDPDEVSLVRDGEDLVVDGRVRVRRDSLIDRVQAVQLTLGEQVVVLRPVASAEWSTHQQLVVPFSARLPVSEGVESLRVVCAAGSRDRYIRSYTFDLPAE